MRLDFYTGERERFLNFDFCYELTNCATGQTIISNSSDVLEPLYNDNKVVKVTGHEGCWSISTTYGSDCYDAIPVTVPQSYESCNECLKYNYKLVNCFNNEVIYTNYLECPSCISYINGLMYTNIEPNPCWYVTVASLPIGPIITVQAYEGYCEQCEGKCYTVTGTGVITYFDSYGELTTTDAPAIICSSSYPSVAGTNNEIVINNLFCDNRNPCAYYYRLTNCATQEQILSNEPDLAFPYALDQTVKLAEYPDACWTIEQFPIVN